MLKLGGGGSDYVRNVTGFCCQMQQKPVSVCIPPKRGTARVLRTLTQDLLAEVLQGLPLKELQIDPDAWIDYYPLCQDSCRLGGLAMIRQGAV
jgi:hypothetical protein